MRKTMLRAGVVMAIALAVVLVASVVAGGKGQAQAGQPDSVFALSAPPFVNVAYGQEGESPLGGGFPDDEVGIAGYFNAGVTIDLADVVGLYTTIEDQTSDYILGSMSVPGYSTNWDVHVYVHTSGWVMIYYRNNEPTSMIFDTVAYGNGISQPVLTKFQPVRDNLASAIGIAPPTLTYYHFAFPNANTMMLIADGAGFGGDDSFQIEIPSTNTYYERSWWSDDSYFHINDVYIGGGYGLYYDDLTSTQLPSDMLHLIFQDNVSSGSNSGIVLIYLEP